MSKGAENIIIPDFSGGFNVDWTKTIPIDRNTLEFFIAPRISIIFNDIYNAKEGKMFSIGEAMEQSKEFRTKRFNTRLRRESIYKAARVRKIFRARGRRNNLGGTPHPGDIYSIFFDNEEIDILARLFEIEVFTAIVTFRKDGQDMDLMDFADAEIILIMQILEYWHAVYPMDIGQYYKYKQHRKAVVREVDGMKQAIKAALMAGGVALMIGGTVVFLIQTVREVGKAIGAIVSVEVIAGGD